MEYSEKYDVFICEVDMPLSIKAFIKSINGHTFISVNSRLSDEAKRREVLHEMEHYKNCDLVKEMPVILIEKNTEEIVKKRRSKTCHPAG